MGSVLGLMRTEMQRRRLRRVLLWGRRRRRQRRWRRWRHRLLMQRLMVVVAGAIGPGEVVAFVRQRHRSQRPLPGHAHRRSSVLLRDEPPFGHKGLVLPLLVVGRRDRQLLDDVVRQRQHSGWLEEELARLRTAAHAVHQHFAVYQLLLNQLELLVEPPSLLLLARVGPQDLEPPAVLLLLLGLHVPMRICVRRVIERSFLLLLRRGWRHDALSRAFSCHARLRGPDAGDAVHPRGPGYGPGDVGLPLTVLGS